MKENQIYNKAKKIRTDLLLYTEKYIKQKQKNNNNSNELLNIGNTNICKIESMEVNFEEFYFENNVEIFTQEVENQENKIIPNLQKISFYKGSEKSVLIFKNSSDLSTEESIKRKKNIYEKNLCNDKNIFLFRKSKTKSEKKLNFENNLKKNQEGIYLENVNKNGNKNIKTFNGNLFSIFKKRNIIGKKYLKNLSKYLGVKSHKKHKILKNILIKKLKKKKHIKKEEQ